MIRKHPSVIACSAMGTDSFLTKHRHYRLQLQIAATINLKRRDPSTAELEVAPQFGTRAGFIMTRPRPGVGQSPTCTMITR